MFLNNFSTDQIRLLLYILLFLLSLYIFKKILSPGKYYKRKVNLPPETWFYSKLIDIEIRKEKENKILDFFFEYISRKYRIKILTEDEFLNKIDDIDENIRVKDFLKVFFEELLVLKKNNYLNTVNYIKEIKFNFNKVDLAEWLRQFDLTNRNNC